MISSQSWVHCLETEGCFSYIAPLLEVGFLTWSYHFWTSPGCSNWSSRILNETMCMLMKRVDLKFYLWFIFLHTEIVQDPVFSLLCCLYDSCKGNKNNEILLENLSWLISSYENIFLVSAFFFAYIYGKTIIWSR